MARQVRPVRSGRLDPVDRRPPEAVDPADPWAGDLVGDEELVRDRRGRLWAIRPVPRGRYDAMGFGVLWWAIFWAIVIGLLVWWAWG